MTHEQLIERALRWLRGRRGCKLVISEAGVGGEKPDAIGWRFREGSHLVECKVSLADFHHDKRKVWRRQRGLGLFRWYLTPPGLLKNGSLNSNTDSASSAQRKSKPFAGPLWAAQKDGDGWRDYWGLIEAHPRQIRIVRQAQPVPFAAWNYQAELWLLTNLCLRERAFQSRDFAIMKVGADAAEEAG